MKYALCKGQTGTLQTWDLHTVTPEGTDVVPLFLQSDEIDREIRDAEYSLLNLMHAGRYVSPDCMGARIAAFVEQKLPRSCRLIRWRTAP